MKCSNCGTELKEGFMYCSVCGKETQVINGFTELEEDYLSSILKEETKRNEMETNRRERTDNTHPKKTDNGHPVGKKGKLNQKIPIIIVVCVLAVAILTGIIIKLYINYKNGNSYDYQIEMAEKQLAEANYEKALGYFSNALVISPNDVAARMEMADIYMQQKDYDSALVLLMEVISLDKKNADAYQDLITIYAAKGQFGQIKVLSEGVEEEEILKLFEEYLVSAPVFYPAGGSYDSYLTVTLISVDEAEIYYTTDGSDPTENGKLYDESGIDLEKTGNYVIKGVCRNEYGIYSEVKEYAYKIEIKAPGYPSVSPNGGNFTEPTFVTIQAAEDCSVFYTWDGTSPSRLTEQYTEPLEVPEGNNILSVIVINDRTGLSSQIYRANFIYEPQE